MPLKAHKDEDRLHCDELAAIATGANSATGLANAGLATSYLDTNRFFLCQRIEITTADYAHADNTPMSKT